VSGETRERWRRGGKLQFSIIRDGRTPNFDVNIGYQSKSAKEHATTIVRSLHIPGLITEVVQSAGICLWHI
jgi:hypothetical protein